MHGTPDGTSPLDWFENRAGAASLFGAGHVGTDGGQELAELSRIEHFLSSFGRRAARETMGP
jgi:hypothetical protein